jgi:hypothetical protein
MMQAPRELVIASHSHPNVIFEDKAGAYQRAATFISSLYAAIQMCKLNQVRFITFGAFNFGAIIIILWFVVITGNEMLVTLDKLTRFATLRHFFTTIKRADIASINNDNVQTALAPRRWANDTRQNDNQSNFTLEHWGIQHNDNRQNDI